MRKQYRIQNIADALKVFEECAIIRGTAIMNGDSKTANKLYPILNKALVYLYEHDSLATLHSFLSHEDFNVRQIAAYALLPLYEKESKDILWEIENGDFRIYGIQGLNAKRTLMLWESGEIYFPYKQIRRRTIKKEEEVFPQETNKAEETTKSKEFSPEILRLSQIFKNEHRPMFIKTTSPRISVHCGYRFPEIIGTGF